MPLCIVFPILINLFCRYNVRCILIKHRFQFAWLIASDSIQWTQKLSLCSFQFTYKRWAYSQIKLCPVAMIIIIMLIVYRQQLPNTGKKSKKKNIFMLFSKWQEDERERERVYSIKKLNLKVIWLRRNDERVSSLSLQNILEIFFFNYDPTKDEIFIWQREYDIQ